MVRKFHWLTNFYFFKNKLIGFYVLWMLYKFQEHVHIYIYIYKLANEFLYF